MPSNPAPFALLTLITLLFASAAFAGSAEDEAKRQIELARADLEVGHLERAILSARSAMRLDPLRYDAMLVLAAAYEQDGDAERARALGLAYAELTGKAAPAVEVAEVEVVQDEDEDERRRPGRIETRVLSSDDDLTVVRVSVAGGERPPTLHWRKRGGDWKAARLGRGDDGRWECTLRLSEADGRLAYWVEDEGEVLVDRDDDGKQRPFRLALN